MCSRNPSCFTQPLTPCGLLVQYAAAAVGDEGKICHVRHGDWDKAGVASFVSQWAARSSMAGRWNEADPERSAQMAEGQSTPTAERHADSDDDAAVDERDFVDNKVWEAVRLRPGAFASLCAATHTTSLFRPVAASRISFGCCAKQSVCCAAVRPRQRRTWTLVSWW